MSDWHTVLQIREELARKSSERSVAPGPFVTISRQYGCSGMALGRLLADELNRQAPPGVTWKVYGREILEQLARENDLAAGVIEQLKRQKPSLMIDFFRALSEKHIPSGYEIRNRITAIVRGLAYKGHAIIVGQGGSGATGDMDNGLSVRVEAPLDWRIEVIRKRDGLSPAKTGAEIQWREKERAYLRKIYAMRFPREVAFDITYDNSRFAPEQIARHVVAMMKLKKIVP